MSDLGGDAGQLTRYLGAIRRRWPILVACIVLGAVIGAVTTQQAEATRSITTKNYFKATHTLISDSVFVPVDDKAGTGTGNLSQDAFLVTTGEVPVRTANKLGLPLEAILSSVTASPRGDVSSLEITAFAASPDDAVRLADTSATELMAYLGETASARYNKQRDDVLARLDDLKKQRTVLEQQLAVTPVDQRPLATPELDSVINQYRVTYEQFQQLAAQGQPSAGLRTIQASTPIEITSDQYASERSQIIAGASAAAPTTTTTDVKKSASSAPAPPASAPVRAGAGGFLGLLVGISLVLLLDRFDTRLRRRETVEAATGLAVLSEIPPLDRKEQHETHVLAAAEPRSSTAEAYRVVRTAMVFARSDFTKSTKSTLSPKRGEVVMVTSPNPSEGKTTSVANLAAVFAEGGQSVLVIDCDFRRPRIHRYLAEGFDLDGEHDDDPLSMTITAANGKLKAMPTDIEGVRLVTGMGEAFPGANPIEIVQFQREVIEFARQHFDIVMLDTAPFLTTNDASELLEETDVVFLVVRSGKTPYAAANRASEFLRRLDAPVLGVILTASADATAAQYYYHYYLGTEGSRRRAVTEAAANGNGNGSLEKVTVPEPQPHENSRPQEP
jgi:capsular exopolysaccharide synthesis family protein